MNTTDFRARLVDLYGDRPAAARCRMAAYDLGVSVHAVHSWWFGRRPITKRTIKALARLRRR